MYYIKLFEHFLLEKKLNKVLYHGSPYFFTNFDENITFFSDTYRFAEDYAMEKSQDAQMDASPKVYECEVDANIFDITVKEDFEKIKNKLPEKITVFLTNFPIPSEMNKDELLMNMQGYDIEQPYEEVLAAKIGDLITDPSYHLEKHKVYKKDSDYVYTISMKEYNRYLEYSMKEDLELTIFSDRKYTKAFEPAREYVKELIRKYEDTKFPNQNTITAYSIVLSGGVNYFNIDITANEKKEFEKLYNQGKKDLMKIIIDEGKIKKWILKPRKVELSDTWRYYENDTITPIISNLGYDGYIAKENGVNTYAIFNPKKNVKIVKYHLPDGEFNNVDEIKKFREYDKYIYDKNKHLKNVFKYNSHDIYILFKKGISKEKAANIIKNKIENVTN